MSGDDYSRLDDASLVDWIGNRAFMRITHTHAIGHCAALVPDVGGNFMCSVYEKRPQVCRDLLRGSAGCAGEIHAKEARPPRLVASLIRLA